MTSASEEDAEHRSSAPDPAFLRWLPAAWRARVRPGSLLYRLATNASWLMAERIVNLGVRFAVGVWVVRYLGPEHYGIYSYALSLVGISAAFASLGLDTIIVRRLTRQEQSDASVLATGLVLRLVAGLAIFGFVALLVLRTESDALTQFVVLLVAGQLLVQALNVFDLWFQANILSRYAVWIRSLSTVFLAGTQIAFILVGCSVAWFAALVTVQMTLKVIGIWGAYVYVSQREEYVSPGAWRFVPSLARSMMRDAWPLIAGGLSTSVFMKVDQIMLEALVSNEAVGVYATAVRLSELWYFIPMAVVGSVYPVIVRMRDAVDEDTYRERMQALYDALALISYAVVLPIVFFAQPLVELLFGMAYAEAGAILQVHIWAFLFVSINVAWGRWMIAENRTRLYMAGTVLSALANVGLNLVLIPYFGGLAAAWATLASQVVVALGVSAVVPSLHPNLKLMARALLVPVRIRQAIRALRQLASMR